MFNSASPDVTQATPEDAAAIAALETLTFSAPYTEKSVRETVAAIVNHPLIPHDIQVHGFIIDSHTGELTRVQGL